MIIYGYICVSSDDYPEGSAKLFKDKDECLKAAYEDYKNTWESCAVQHDFEDGKDENENEMADFDEFKRNLLIGNEENIQLSSSHICYRLFWQELK